MRGDQTNETEQADQTDQTEEDQKGQFYDHIPLCVSPIYCMCVMFVRYLFFLKNLFSFLLFCERDFFVPRFCNLLSQCHVSLEKIVEFDCMRKVIKRRGEVKLKSRQLLSKVVVFTSCLGKKVRDYRTQGRTQSQDEGKHDNKGQKLNLNIWILQISFLLSLK